MTLETAPDNLAQTAALPQFPWFCIRALSQRERLAAESLSRLATVFYPQIPATRAKRYDPKPLFSRYLFASYEPEQHWAVAKARGVERIVRFTDQPAEVPIEVILGLQARCDERGVIDLDDEARRLAVSQADYQPGEQVEVIRGPFSGLPGHFLRMTTDERVVVLLSILGRPTEQVIDPRAVLRVV